MKELSYDFIIEFENGTVLWYEPITDLMDGFVLRQKNGGIIDIFEPKRNGQPETNANVIAENSLEPLAKCESIRHEDGTEDRNVKPINIEPCGKNTYRADYAITIEATDLTPEEASKRIIDLIKGAGTNG